MAFDPSVVIETKRLRLRFVESKDRHDIYVNINHDKDVLTYFLDRYREKEEDMTLDKVIAYFKQAERYIFALERKDTGEVIGMILQCSSPDIYFKSSEVGYAIGKKHWNQGYVSEAFKAMIDFLFSIGVHKVTASYLEGNEASKRVMEKCGLVYEGRKKDDVYYHDRFYDTENYYIINPKE